MKANDFFICTFQGDQTSYVAEIIGVHSGLIDCRFVHSEKQYRFSTSNWRVVQSNGGFKAGTPLTSHKIYSQREGPVAPNNYVAVTFGNDKSYLGILKNTNPLVVSFLHGSNATYTFDNNNVIIKSGGAYPVGQTIKGITLYELASEAGIAAAPAGTNVSSYDPAREDTLVINTKEFPSDLPGFRNYKGWKQDTTIPHNRKQKQIRSLADIKHLVLHETASDTGDGFFDANDTTAHLSVLKNGTVLQFNDIVERQYHVGVFNNTAIGIEFVNSGWVQGMPSKEQSLNAQQRQKYGEDKGYLWAFCGLGQNIYKLPQADQLEKLVTLTSRFLNATEEGMPKIGQNWLQLVSYNDIKEVWRFASSNDVPPEDEKDIKQFFIFSHGDLFMVPENFKNNPGILSHASTSSVINGKVDKDAHSDGSFLTLYTWLRIEKGLAEEAALEKAKKLIKEQQFFAKTIQTFSNSKGEMESRLVIMLLVSDTAINQ